MRIQGNPWFILHSAFWIVALSGAMSSRLAAQQLIINNQGERIVIFPDGSWRLAEAGDSVLLQQALQKAGMAQAAQNAGKSKATVDRQNSNLVPARTELLKMIRTQSRITQDSIRKATNAQFRAKQLVENAKSSKNKPEPAKMQELEKNYKTSIAKLKELKKQEKTIEKIRLKAEKLSPAPAKLEWADLQKVQEEFIDYLKAKSPGTIPPPPASQPQVKREQVVTSNSPQTHSTTTAKTSPPELQTLPPAYRQWTSSSTKAYPCKFVTDTIDASSGRPRLELPYDLLFTHTDPELRPFFKNKELITCRAKVIMIGPYTYLGLEFEIASSNPQNNFGGLAQGSLLRLKLMSGEFISMYNIKSDAGRLNAYTGHTIFSALYAMGKTEMNKLAAHDLDKIRVLWGTGYEDYEVIYMDLLKNQLGCLKDKQ